MRNPQDPLTIYDLVREPYEYQCRKHELAPDAEVYATEQINKLSNDELLMAISEAWVNVLETTARYYKGQP